jgi:hypothetical protein
MTTTAIFAEILVIGLFAVLAVVSLIFASTGVSVDNILRFRDWVFPATLAIIAVVYPIGIGVDRAADSLLDWLQKAWFTSSLKITEREMLFRIWKKGPVRTISFLDYAQSRRRIARAAGAISVLVAIAALNLAPWRGWGLLALAGVFLMISVLCGYAWWRIGKMYYSRLELAYRVHVRNLEEGTGNDLQE